MIGKSSTLWARVRTSYWFIPGGMILSAIGLSFFTIVIDEELKEKWSEARQWVWSGSPEGARVMLSAIAGSMVTVAGVVFSITMVVLALASNQFGPRTLRNFMRDRGTQLVLGTFLSTFVYCLLVLRTVRGEENSEEFVPHLSVTTGVVLALASVGVLVYFVHHVSSAIQSGNLLASIAGELQECLDRVCPKEGEKNGKSEGGPSRRFSGDGVPLHAVGSGYIQSIDEKRLVELAAKHDLQFDLSCAPGDYICEGSILARVSGDGDKVDSLKDKIRQQFVLGTVRTPVQDLEYCVHRLAEVGIRALSPGTNDPYTAIVCLDHLGGFLNQLVQRPSPPAFRNDEEGRCRVIIRQPDFARLAGAACHQMRQDGCSHVSVMIRMLSIIRGVAPRVRRPADREVLRDHLWRIEHDFSRVIENPRDLQTLREHHREALVALLGVRNA